MDILFDISIIVIICAILSYIFILIKQPIIIAYILTGIIIAQTNGYIVKNMDILQSLSHIGLPLLLFFAGIVLHPNRLIQLFKETLKITLSAMLTSLLIFFILSILILKISYNDALFTAIALMFSSTILAIKLLPTITLHHKKMGSFCIAILIAEDIVAVLVLLFINTGKTDILSYLFLFLKGIVFTILLFTIEQFLLRKILRKVSKFTETLYILTIGWALLGSIVGHYIGFSYEIGAFISGVAMARNPLSIVLAEELKFFRDFFLMLFFVSMGASLNIQFIQTIWIKAIIFAILFVIIKPFIIYIFTYLFGENRNFSTEAGIRLGQASEFALIIATIAFIKGYITGNIASLIQVIVIFTMILSSYLTVFLYPSPLGTKERLKVN